MNAYRSVAFALCFILGGCSGTKSQAHQASPAAETAKPSQTPMAHLDAQQRYLANVGTATVALQPFTTTVTAAGRITYDESRLSRVTAWVDGRIQRLHVSRPGEMLRKDQPLADLYSPDLVSTQQELILAAQSVKELEGSVVPGVLDDAKRLLESGRRRLALWGLSTNQIENILKLGQPLTVLPILSPASGVVIRKMVQPGDWVDKGMPMLEIADLSRVWVEADVYEYELASLRPGQKVKVETLSYPGAVFWGRIGLILPVMNAETRTNTVRVELDNPGGRLKPDMYVTATMVVSHGKRLVVPSDAVLETGKRQVVWVEHAPGQFGSREVRVGSQGAEQVEILSGLKPGEHIAVSGGFMLDASSQLGRGSSAHGAHGSKPEAKPSSAHAGHAEH